jgi:hypothetical protein
MKVFVFNSLEKWDTSSGYAIFADTKEEADTIYKKIKEDPDSYEIKEYEIEKGLILSAFGYDTVAMLVEYG